MNISNINNSLKSSKLYLEKNNSINIDKSIIEKILNDEYENLAIINNKSLFDNMILYMISKQQQFFDNIKELYKINNENFIDITKETDLYKKTFSMLNVFLNNEFDEDKNNGFIIYLAHEYQLLLISFFSVCNFDNIKTDFKEKIAEFLILNQDVDGSFGLLNPLNKFHMSDSEFNDWKYLNTIFGFIFISKLDRGTK